MTTHGPGTTQPDRLRVTFRAVLELHDKTATGIVVPDEVVDRL